MQIGRLSRAASGLSAALIGAGFFLPWISVTVDASALDRVAQWGVSGLLRPVTAGLRLQFSAWDLAWGPQLKAPLGLSWQLGGTPELWGVLVAAVAALVVVLLMPTPRLAAIGALAAGGIGAAMLMVSLQRLEASKIPYTASSLEPGLWLAAGGLAGLIVSGLLTLGARTEADTGPAASGPPPLSPRFPI